MKLPVLLCPEYQNYILHFVDCGFAELITKSPAEIKEAIEKESGEIFKIEKERNFHGLSDYRIYFKIA